MGWNKRQVNNMVIVAHPQKKGWLAFHMSHIFRDFLTYLDGKKRPTAFR